MFLLRKIAFRKEEIVKLLKKEDFDSNGIKYDDLLFNEDTGLVLNNTQSKYRVANHFDYGSELKSFLDNYNAIQNELKELDEFVDLYFKKEIDKFILPDNLRITNISETKFLLNKSTGKFSNKILRQPECYYYKGKFPPQENTFNNRYKISYNKPFTFEDFENKSIIITM